MRSAVLSCRRSAGFGRLPRPRSSEAATPGCTSRNNRDRSESRRARKGLLGAAIVLTIANYCFCHAW
eukprot:12980573-Alexandrium_andersonii.AAC.1